MLVVGSEPGLTNLSVDTVVERCERETHMITSQPYCQTWLPTIEKVSITIHRPELFYEMVDTLPDRLQRTKMSY